MSDRKPSPRPIGDGRRTSHAPAALEALDIKLVGGELVVHVGYDVQHRPVYRPVSLEQATAILPAVRDAETPVVRRVDGRTAFGAMAGLGVAGALIYVVWWLAGAIGTTMAWLAGGGFMLILGGAAVLVLLMRAVTGGSGGGPVQNNYYR